MEVSDSQGMHGPRATAIIIDDSRTMRMHLRLLLEASGCEVVAEGDNGKAVLPLYEAHNPDFITIDIIMPGKDGLKAATELLEAHPSAKVLMCTSLTRRDKVLACKRAGVTHYIVKPFDAVAIEASVKRALGRG